MRHLAFAFFVLTWPAALWAQQVAVRGGEHGDFTRLVFSVPAGTLYTLGEPGPDGAFHLALDREALRFDASDTFSRITRERIADLVASGSAPDLEIRLNCNCTVDSFVLRDTMLVIDISGEGGVPVVAPSHFSADGSATEHASVAGLPAATGQGATTAIAAKTTAPIIDPLARDLSLLRLDGAPGIGPAKRPDPLLPSVSIIRPPEPQAQGTELHQSGDDPVNPASVGDDIAAELARAATQGLLDPALHAAPDPLTLRPASQRHADMPSEADSGAHPAVVALAEQLAEITHDKSELGVISIGAEQCTPDKRLRIATWAGKETILEVLGQDRSDLVGEFDKVNVPAIKRFAKALLHFGFGAEARSVLYLDPEGPDPMLRAMSHIVDGEDDPTDYFRGLVNCEGTAAFWAAMDGGVQAEQAVYDGGAILLGLEALPAHLRDYLGPILADKLTQAGKTSVARDVLRRLERMHGGPTDELALEKARIQLRDGNVAEASETLSAIGSLPGSRAADAVVTRVDIAHASDEGVSEEIVQLTAAYAAELKDSPQGPDVWRAHVRSLLLNRQFGATLAALEMADDMPEDMRKELLLDTFRSLTKEAEDIDFLKFVTREDLHSRDLPDPALQLAILQRLEDLGLPDTVLDRLDGYAEMPGAHDFRVVRARALLDLSRPEEAEIVLIGLRGDDIAGLRAEARRQMGDHAYARELYETMGETDEALNAAWLSGDWDRVAQEEDSPLAQAARLLEAGEPPSEEPSLGYAERLSGDSAETRATLRALLDATRIGGD